MRMPRNDCFSTTVNVRPQGHLQPKMTAWHCVNFPGDNIRKGSTVGFSGNRLITTITKAVVGKTISSIMQSHSEVPAPLMRLQERQGGTTPMATEFYSTQEPIRFSQATR